MLMVCYYFQKTIRVWPNILSFAKLFRKFNGNSISIKFIIYYYYNIKKINIKIKIINRLDL